MSPEIRQQVLDMQPNWERFSEPCKTYSETADYLQIARKLHPNISRLLDVKDMKPEDQSAYLFNIFFYLRALEWKSSRDDISTFTAEAYIGEVLNNANSITDGGDDIKNFILGDGDFIALTSAYWGCLSAIEDYHLGDKTLEAVITIRNRTYKLITAVLTFTSAFELSFYNVLLETYGERDESTNIH